MVINFPMASFDQKSAGYPIGGSLAWAQPLAEKLESLCGKFPYKKPV